MYFSNITSKTIYTLVFIFVSFFLRCNNSEAGQSFILLIDNSESMKNSDHNRVGLDAMTLIVDMLTFGDRISVVQFPDDLHEIISDKITDSNSKYKICKKIKTQINYEGLEKTDIIGVLDTLKLKKNGLDLETPDFETSLILLTDGIQTVQADRDFFFELENVLKTYIVHEIPIHAIALGKEADNDLLRTLAHKTNGSYFSTQGGYDLLDIYLKIINTSKGLAKIKSSTFDVWDKSTELTIVLFSSELQKYSNSVLFNGKPFELSHDKIYRSKNRKKFTPKFYDIIRITNPKPGPWSLSVNGKRNLITYALQPFPFEINMLKPNNRKHLKNEEVDFMCELEPKMGTDRLLLNDLNELLKSTKIALRINKKNRIPKEEKSLELADDKSEFFQNNRFHSKFPFDQEGFYTYEIVGRCKIIQYKDETWETQKNGVFYVGPPDFNIKIDKPNSNSPPIDPFKSLEIVATVIKNDPKCSFDVLPKEANFKAKVFDHQGNEVLNIPCLVSGSLITVPVLDGIEPIFDSGKYIIKISGSHHKVRIKENELSFSIKWPEPDIRKLRSNITISDEGDVIIGEDVNLHASLLNGKGETIKIGETIDNVWQIESVYFKEFEWIDNEGTELIPIISGGLPTGYPIKHKFGFPPRCYGNVTVKGKAKLILKPAVNGTSKEKRKKTLEANSVYKFISDPKGEDTAIDEIVMYDENYIGGNRSGSLTKWPAIDDFKISHNFPKSLSLESNILVYENNSLSNQTSFKSYFVELNYVHNKDKARLEKNSLIDEQFKVEDIKWDLPKSITNVCNPVFKKYKSDNLGNTMLVGSFFHEGVSKFLLSVNELVLGFDNSGYSENKRTKTYRNIETLVEIQVSSQ